MISSFTFEPSTATSSPASSPVCVESKGKLGDRVIAISTQIKDLLMSLIVKIIALIKGCFTPSAFPLTDQSPSLKKNFEKAIVEHKKQNVPETSHQKISKVEASFSATLLEFCQAQNIGGRKKMEDVPFIVEIAQGQVLGVCDGHSDDGLIAKYVADKFPSYFAGELKALPNVKQAFEKAIEKIHAEVIARKEFDTGGTTFVASFIPKNTNVIYTATLGDSEIKIYRDDDFIPLSCVRDWKSRKDAKRAAIALENDALAEQWPKNENRKKIRFPFPDYGINVSGAIGDRYFSDFNGKTGVSQKCKVTEAWLKKGDVIVVGSDGLWDYAPEDQLLQALSQLRGVDRARNFTSNLATNLVGITFQNDCLPEDNVTVLTAVIS